MQQSFSSALYVAGDATPPFTIHVKRLVSYCVHGVPFLVCANKCSIMTPHKAVSARSLSLVLQVRASATELCRSTCSVWPMVPSGGGKREPP